jgi:zinc-ribbon domain
MAFCNSCGSNLQTGAKFCPKCGATVPAAPAVSTPNVAPAAPPSQSSSAVKIVLIVVAVIFGLGILAVGSLTFIGWHIARHSHVRTVNGEVHVDTPFGTVDTTDNPQQAAHDMGVDIYPGATAQKEGNANVSFGHMHTAALNLETSDPPEKVFDFYRAKFPSANVTTGENGQYSIVSGDQNNLLTIAIATEGGNTAIHIAKVTK